ncbi:hypothetical protein HNY73_019252 [Argiope bruennichi]|uniref:Uncharacterized protein n=1 Tax=Argiope bruennichi TaxID=94029 RepID=A0A8T0EJR8_ARGBR|nr:hypothetical protein HNY73_019252 [Argiope bruennichi]
MSEDSQICFASDYISMEKTIRKYLEFENLITAVTNKLRIKSKIFFKPQMTVSIELQRGDFSFLIQAYQNHHERPIWENSL